MWVFTKVGFFSIVQSSKNKEQWQIRARAKNDLEALKKLAGSSANIIKTTTSDYRYRLIVNEKVKNDIFQTLSRSIDYSNFKDKIEEVKSQREKLPLLMRIWNIMFEYQYRKENDITPSIHDVEDYTI